RLPMIRLFVGMILLACLVPPAFAAPDAAAVNNAEFKGKTPADDKINPAVVKAQVLLDRARFSPGEIDGKLGENAQKALKAFAEAKGLDPKRPLTPDTWTALAGTSSGAVITEYKISNDDIKGPFLERLPARMEDMKKFKVVSADANPTYRYHPAYKFKGVKSKEAFTIRPGPNNPVGSFWIGLSAEGYGIHGTSNPSTVSKAESHGCVRLTNWDAVLLGR